jgi:crotonobetainyl-CoA:carnitine CoA-transferase CaiB-like acyl-CoA transferase
VRLGLQRRCALDDISWAAAARLSAPSAPPPGRGAHNEEILAEFGVSPDEIAALRAAGTI